MQTMLWNKKWIVSDCTNQEKMYLRRNGVNIKTQGANLILEDNIFNRILLERDVSDILSDNTPCEQNIQSAARAYQCADITAMLRNKFTLNRNKPGYGKTFESIEYCRLRNFKKILVVCPKSVVTQWRDQFAKWWPEVAQDVSIWGDGPVSADRVIYVTNYEQLTPRNVSKVKGKKVLMPTQVWQRCKQWVWDVIIVDESHRIKSSSSQITGALEQLPSKNRLCLTGTPILSRPNDLWSQLHFMDPRLSGSSYWAFTERFCEIDVDNFGKKPIGLTPSESAQQLLAKALSLISVGGNNHEVTEGKNIIPILLEMDVKQRNLYKAIANLAIDSLEEKGITVKNAMDQFIKMQQVTTNCGKFTEQMSDDKLGEKTVLCPRNPKFEWIKDWLEDNEEEKLVIYSKYAETVKALAEYLSKHKIKHTTYIGEMSGNMRNANKDEFIRDKQVRVIIGTIGALGTGVDGLQHVCRNVVFLDRDWTPGLNEQAEDRVNRSGQVGMTNVWILHMRNSVDEYVEGVQGKKADDILEVFRRVRDCT